jgi:uncharacterized protein
MVEERPNWRTGKLCYIEIPAADVARSAEFYQQAFGWNLRQRIYQQSGLAETEAAQRG